MGDASDHEPPEPTDAAGNGPDESDQQPREATEHGEVDPLAPGRTLVDPDLDDAIEPNEPA
jgi:hypothetical protein